MRWSKIRGSIAFPLFIGAVIAIAIVFREPINTLLDSEDALEGALASFGIGAAPALVVVQILQVIIFIIPGEVVQIAAGYLFGVLPGTVLSIVGILLGSAFNYWIGRLLGQPFVETVASPRTLRRIDEVTSRRGARVGFFLLFVIPGIPKDILCYVAGTAGPSRGVSFPFFLVFSTIGRIPGIVGSAVIGASAAQGGIIPAIVLLSLAVVLLVAGIAWQHQLERVVSGISRRLMHRR